MDNDITSSFRRRAYPRRASFTSHSKVNPFVLDVEWTLRRKLQVILMTMFVVPIKLFIFGIMLFITWSIAKLITLQMKEPMQEPGYLLTTNLANLYSKMCRFSLYILGLRVDIRGKRASPNEASLFVVAPHSSYWDFTLGHLSCPLVSFIMEKYNEKVPIFGTIYKASGPIFVSRIASNSTQQALQQIERRAKSPDKWPQTFIFPEATTTNRKVLISFKKGAFLPGVPVQPIAMEYLNDWDTFTWAVMGPSLKKFMWLSMCQFSIKMRITYLPVYNPSAEEKADARLYANNVRQVMADALGIPCTEHSYDDCRLMYKAGSLNMPMEIGLVEFANLSRKLGVNIDDMKDYLEEYSKIPSEKPNGLISIKDFSKFLKVPITPVLRELFRLYDLDDSGFIDFREYVIGLSVVSKPAATKETVKLLFTMFKNDKNGLATGNELNKLLRAVFGDNANHETMCEEIDKTFFNGATFEKFSEFLVQRPEYAKLILLSKEITQPDNS